MSSPPPLLAVRLTAQNKQVITAMQYLLREHHCLSQLMQEAGKKVAIAQEKYNKYFDKRVWLAKRP